MYCVCKRFNLKQALIIYEKKNVFFYLVLLRMMLYYFLDLFKTNWVEYKSEVREVKSVNI